MSKTENTSDMYQDVVYEIRSFFNKGVDPSIIKYDDLLYIRNYIFSRPIIPLIKEYFNKHNIYQGVLSETDTHTYILDSFQTEKEMQLYVDYIESPLSLKNIPTTGNIIDILHKHTNISKKTLRKILHLKGTENGRGVGKGEIILSIFFEDVSFSLTKGDLSWDGKYLEVKGTDARLGKRDCCIFNFDKTGLGRFSDKLETKRIDKIVEHYSNKCNKNELVKYINEFIKTGYPESDYRLFSLNDDIKHIRKFITLHYFRNYKNREGVDKFIFINTGNTNNQGKYIIFCEKNVENLILNDIIGCGPITYENINPQILSVK